jgi:hypothetical protein
LTLTSGYSPRVFENIPLRSREIRHILSRAQKTAREQWNGRKWHSDTAGGFSEEKSQAPSNRLRPKTIRPNPREKTRKRKDNGKTRFLSISTFFVFKGSLSRSVEQFRRGSAGIRDNTREPKALFGSRVSAQD